MLRLQSYSKSLQALLTYSKNLPVRCLSRKPRILINQVRPKEESNEDLEPLEKSMKEEIEYKEKLERMRIMAEVDIYQESFKSSLKDFCHYYQIPFLENNIPKTCKNAAKILYRLEADAENISEEYAGLVQYLKSIPKEEIEENFDPNLMKEKWMKFFRGGFSRVLVDTDRTLKNDLNEALKIFI